MKPEDRLLCRREVAQDERGLPVFCNLPRLAHPHTKVGGEVNGEKGPKWPEHDGP
jgi:hypothetical protein